MNSNRRRLIALSAVAIIALGAVIALAQRQRASPHETIELTLNGKKVSITYGRPYAKGRKIVGGLVPYDKVWRTGADEATTLVTETDLTIGDLSVPAGSYTLFSLPTETGWKLIVNKATGQWGTQYDAGQDFGRADMKVKALSAPVEQFTMKLAGSGKNGTLTLEWEKTEATITVVAK